MYVCSCDQLKLRSGATVTRGDPVPEAADWPENVRRANLRLGYIEERKVAAGTNPVAPPASVSVASAAAPRAGSPAPGGSALAASPNLDPPIEGEEETKAEPEKDPREKEHEPEPKPSKATTFNGFKKHKRR